MAAEFEVVQLQVLHAAARHLSMQLAYAFESSLSRVDSPPSLPRHEAFRVISERKTPVRAGQEAVVTRDGLQRYLRVAAVDVCPGQEVATDHFQAVASGLVGSQHQSHGLDRLLDNGDLTFVGLEIDRLRGFTVLARQLFLDFPVELGLRGISLALCSQVALSNRCPSLPPESWELRRHCRAQ
jgi:hypothetical protein